MTYVVHEAQGDDFAAAGRLLHDFNEEFGDPTPPAAQLADRLRHLVANGDTAILIVEEAGTSIGIAVLRFRDAIFTSGLESYLAELYVVPERRGHGAGRVLMEAALELARARSADTMNIEVDEPDSAARALYESLGFRNRSGGEDGPLMYVYERDL